MPNGWLYVGEDPRGDANISFLVSHKPSTIPADDVAPYRRLVFSKNSVEGYEFAAWLEGLVSNFKQL